MIKGRKMKMVRDGIEKGKGRWSGAATPPSHAEGQTRERK